MRKLNEIIFPVCRLSSLLLAGYLAPLCTVVTAGQLRYSVIPLGSPRSFAYDLGGSAIYPWRINNKGDIVGNSFLYRNGTVYVLEAGQVLDVGSLTINDHGVIAGTAWNFPGY